MKAEFEITDYLKEEEIRYLIAEAIREEVVKDFDLNEMIKDCINDYIKEIVNNDYKEYIKTLIKPRIASSSSTINILFVILLTSFYLEGFSNKSFINWMICKHICIT